jgi:serine/threonine protein kinase
VHARLADFGIARTSDATGTLTGAGLVMGSAPYIAPELLEGRPAGARGDIYAFGVTLFQMLTGRLPFEAATTAAALAARLAREAPLLRQLRPDAPAWLERLVAQCLARDPALRLVDAASLAQALRTARSTTIATAPRMAAVAAPGGYAGAARGLPSGSGSVTEHQTTQVVTVRPRPRNGQNATQPIHSTGVAVPATGFAHSGLRAPQGPQRRSGDARSPEAFGRLCGHVAGTLFSRRLPLRLAGALAVAALLKTV